ncbi:hypothetical protein KM043_004476 [Ampulex compressa]|nr:hypothetical protein KM043_004476 [Ampulex compressa]
MNDKGTQGIRSNYTRSDVASLTSATSIGTFGYTKSQTPRRRISTVIGVVSSDYAPCLAQNLGLGLVEGPSLGQFLPALTFASSALSARLNPANSLEKIIGHDVTLWYLPTIMTVEGEKTMSIHPWLVKCGGDLTREV